MDVVSSPGGSCGCAQDDLRVDMAPVAAASRAGAGRFALAATGRVPHVASRPVILRAVAGSTRAVAFPRSRA